jgi:hypothetical protein
VNGVVVPGERDIDTFKRLIDTELEKARAALASGVSADEIYVFMSRRNMLAAGDARAH